MKRALGAGLVFWSLALSSGCDGASAGSPPSEPLEESGADGSADAVVTDEGVDTASPETTPSDGAPPDATSAVLTMHVTQVDGLRNFYLPLSSPGHAEAYAMRGGKVVPWPSGTTFDAKATSASGCVYVKATGTRAFMFARYSCDETLVFTAKLPTGETLKVEQVVHPYGETAPRTLTAFAIDKASLLPREPLSYRTSPLDPLPVGATAGVYLRVKYARSPVPSEVIVEPGELAAVKITGAALAGADPAAISAVSAGAATVEASFTLPRDGMPSDPFVLSGTGTVNVVDPQPLASLWSGSVDDYVMNVVTTSGACHRHFLMAQYGATATSRYRRVLPWSDATVGFDDPAFATLTASTGDICGTKPGGTLISMTIGGVSSSQKVLVLPSASEPLVTRIAPTTLVLPGPRATGGCGSLKLFARVGTGAEEEVTTNPTVSVSAAVDPSADAGTTIPWVNCYRDTSVTPVQLKCCAMGDSSGTAPRPPTSVTAYYGYVAAQAILTQP